MDEATEKDQKHKKKKSGKTGFFSVELSVNSAYKKNRGNVLTGGGSSGKIGKQSRKMTGTKTLKCR
ncbi:hypothetical protein SANA_00250 [Gottschalkiaceae bacterium SANA]|nr:hypothetical protein SANA_00250 [Gottschalkiaceae bacterium SANA]